MSHRPSRRKYDQEMRRRRDEAERLSAEERAAVNGHAERIIRLWNARAAMRRPPSFYPTIGTAIAAGTPWLSYMCPGCQLVDTLDLRTLDRHAGAAVSSLIPHLSCGWCSPNPPLARLLALRSGRARAK